MDKAPHYSRIADLPELLNPITGRSLYYGLMPWRCDDRFLDWWKGFSRFANPAVQLHLLSLARQCSSSEVGKEPLDDYTFMTRRDALYFAERYQSGMVRERMWSKYPYDQLSMARVQEEDALKMRVWRQQRQLELEAREGKIDDAVAANVLGMAAKARKDKPNS